MKTISLIPACLAATLFLVPSAPAADSASSSVDASSPAAVTRQGEIMKRFDANKDGKLDESEKAAAKAAAQKHRGEAGGKVHQRLLEKYDKNHDGKLDDTERAAALTDYEARPRVIKRFDKNGDGVLNDQEKAAADQWIHERWSKGQDE